MTCARPLAYPPPPPPRTTPAARRYASVGTSLFLTTLSQAFVPIASALLSALAHTLGLSRPAAFTQRRLNAALEGPQFSLSERTSSALNVVFLGLALAGGIPATIPVLAVFVAASFAFDKWFLIKCVLLHFRVMSYVFYRSECSQATGGLTPRPPVQGGVGATGARQLARPPPPPHAPPRRLAPLRRLRLDVRRAPLVHRQPRARRLHGRRPHGGGWRRLRAVRPEGAAAEGHVSRGARRLPRDHRRARRCAAGGAQRAPALQPGVRRERREKSQHDGAAPALFPAALLLVLGRRDEIRALWAECCGWGLGGAVHAADAPTFSSLVASNTLKARSGFFFSPCCACSCCARHETKRRHACAEACIHLLAPAERGAQGPSTYDVRASREHADALADARPLSFRTSPHRPASPRAPAAIAVTVPAAAERAPAAVNDADRVPFSPRPRELAETPPRAAAAPAAAAAAPAEAALAPEPFAFRENLAYSPEEEGESRRPDEGSPGEGGLQPSRAEEAGLPPSLFEAEAGPLPVEAPAEVLAREAAEEAEAVRRRRQEEGGAEEPSASATAAPAGASASGGDDALGRAVSSRRSRAAPEDAESSGGGGAGAEELGAADGEEETAAAAAAGPRLSSGSSRGAAQPPSEESPSERRPSAEEADPREALQNAEGADDRRSSGAHGGTADDGGRSSVGAESPPSAGVEEEGAAKPPQGGAAARQASGREASLAAAAETAREEAEADGAAVAAAPPPPSSEGNSSPRLSASAASEEETEAALPSGSPVGFYTNPEFGLSTLTPGRRGSDDESARGGGAGAAQQAPAAEEPQMPFHTFQNVAFSPDTDGSGGDGASPGAGAFDRDEVSAHGSLWSLLGGGGLGETAPAPPTPPTTTLLEGGYGDGGSEGGGGEGVGGARASAGSAASSASAAAQHRRPPAIAIPEEGGSGENEVEWIPAASAADDNSGGGAAPACSAARGADATACRGL